MSESGWRTILYDEHVKLGARMVLFGGWEMPVEYGGILKEHHAVREGVGLFDVCHMGEFCVNGQGAVKFLNQILTNDVRKLNIGDGQYTLMLNQKGGVVDDLILYRLGEEEFLMVVNASKREEGWKWVNGLPGSTENVILKDASDEYGMMALQGPKSIEVMGKFLGKTDFPKRNKITREKWNGKEFWLARTGYTGEDGFELLCDAKDGAEIWEGLLDCGKAYGCVPCGLGARDTLRLEACLPLNGHELGEDITPLEAGLGFFVKLDKDADFVGKKALQGQDLQRKSVAFEMTVKGPPPRNGYRIFKNSEEIGIVTSGGMSPTLQKGIGLALIKAEMAEPGTDLELEIRDRKFAVRVKKKPLYQRGEKNESSAR